MGWMTRWGRRIATLLRGGRAHREVEEEMGFHIDMEARDLVRQGMEPAEALREARRRFGGTDRHREAVREARGVATLQDLGQDVRGALRGLTRSPGFAAVALLTLALGIGATTAIFSVVQAVLLRPLPYPEAERLLRVRPAWEGTPAARLSPAEFIDLRALDVMAPLGAYAFGSVALTGDGEPERIGLAWLSAGVLPALGVEPMLGRGYTVREDEEGAPVALLSQGLWTRRYGADPAVVGRSITVDGRALTVLGVMPAGFVLPEDLATPGETQLFVPLGVDPVQTQARGSHFLLGVARLPRGVSAGAAQAAVSRAGAAMVRDHPDDYPADMGFVLEARPLAAEVLGGTRPALRLLSGAVAFLLLIACANVANLLLARSEARERELALRRALGAGRGRLVRQLLAESLTLSLLGAALGGGVAVLATRGLLALRPPDVPRIGDVRVDGWALLFAVALATLTGIAFGLLPALKAARSGSAEGLREGGRGHAGGRQSGRLRRGLVVAELAAALVLLTGAGLLTRTLVELVRVDPGYRTEGLLTAELSTPSARYPGGEDVTAFYDRLVAALADQPGVLGAGAVSNLPLATSLGDLNFHIEGRETAQGEVSPRADWQVVTPGYLDAVGIVPVRGRLLDERDALDAPGAVVISETTAHRYWPGGDALGARFRLGGGAGPGMVTVVGIVRDVAHQALDAPPSAQMYLSQAQFRFWGSGAPARSMDLVVRTAGPPAEAAPLVREAVRSLDPTLPVADVRTMEEIVSRSLARSRLLASLVGSFALVALVLSVVGIYGVTAYAVGRRTREMGIRLALGAGAGRVIRLVLGEGVRTVALGVALGIAGALLVSRLLEGFLFGVGAADGATLAMAALVLGGAALAACVVPARRATRVDPALPLRAD